MQRTGGPVPVRRSEPELHDPEFEALTAKISQERGFQCANYKDKCLQRRIHSRMRSRAVVGFANYMNLLDNDAEEYGKLIRSLTINVTKFFRNHDAFAALDRLVVPALWSTGNPVRIWSAGCSSGEEAYTVAILFHRLAVERGEEHSLDRVKIIGTDIDANCVEAANNAVYSNASFTETPPSVATRYFTDYGKVRQLVPEIRRMASFSHGDLLSESGTPQGPFDLIVCRNVIIYFTLDSQARLFGMLHSVLAHGGALMLGKAETLLGHSRRLFTPISARDRLYGKK